jgi:hypothetical protein
VSLPPCLIGIEAGMATHYMARELVALGHEVKQVPQCVPQDGPGYGPPPYQRGVESMIRPTISSPQMTS